MQKFCLILITSFLLLRCGNTSKEITIQNPLAIDRNNETISIALKDLTPTVDRSKKIVVTESGSNKILLSQLIDTDGDDQYDEIIFQVDIKAGEEKSVTIKNGEAEFPEPEKKTYSRFVPERTDDFAWENDLVAFRTYGPEAQKLIEERKSGGTLSSGIDCWLKRVSYPVIDKWYKQYTEGISYHKDHGEGLDNYHVGASRGCGGIGIWLDDSLYVSKNFLSYKTIANGPLRTIFELTYAPWIAQDITVHEKKRISIDLGSQLCRYEVALESDASLPNCTIGITLHDKKGETYSDTVKGWFSYWEPLEDSELGTGVIVDTDVLLSYLDYRTPKKDLSQLYIITKPQKKKLIYYAGFGWKKTGRFNTATDWNNYLNNFSERLKAPLKVSIKQ